jgi:hypothetical protein
LNQNFEFVYTARRVGAGIHIKWSCADSSGECFSHQEMGWRVYTDENMHKTEGRDGQEEESNTVVRQGRSRLTYGCPLWTKIKGFG